MKRWHNRIFAKIATKRKISDPNCYRVLFYQCKRCRRCIEIKETHKPLVSLLLVLGYKGILNLLSSSTTIIDNHHNNFIFCGRT